MVNKRGVIEFVSRARQLIKFEGIRYRNITPTDIDFCLEFDDTLLILGEVKCVGKTMQKGQRLAITRMCKKWVRAGSSAYGFVCVHNIPSNKDVYISECQITEVLIPTEQNGWRSPKNPITVKYFCDELERIHILKTKAT